MIGKINDSTARIATDADFTSGRNANGDEKNRGGDPRPMRTGVKQQRTLNGVHVVPGEQTPTNIPAGNPFTPWKK